jgi:hypothetical protein
MTLMTLPPSVVTTDYVDEPIPTAHVPLDYLPGRAVCGAPIRDIKPNGEFIKCEDCANFIARGQAG